jgi:uncharacterized RDD family membrane protein YckC
VSFVIDRAIISLATFVTVLAIDYVLGAFRINELLGFWEMTPRVRTILSVGIFVLLTICYDIGFWLLAGQTLGKRVIGVRILRSDGTRLHFGNALRREIGYVVSGILFLGFLWILFDNRRQGFHDKLAGTIVVYSWPEEELKGTFIRDQVQRIRHQRQSTRSGGSGG